MSDDDQWRRLRELFDQVQDIPLEERREFLDRELADDPELRGELDSLLNVDATAGAFLASDPTTTENKSIGNYRLLKILGEGGFGMVYLAEQVHPIQRRVALKLILPGMDSKQVIARFEAERQALALMDHPCIAQVFDAGETERGRPYFVMEYVPGIPITKFCDQHRLTIRQRLVLFLQVCEAIQHAHQKGVIHRDIKPSNVLVTMRDGVPAPKVIDFGIVKATTDSTSDRTLMTREGVIVGTLGYMSPEQAGGDDVDTRSDVYSLGVLLYQLVAGALPFDSARLRRAHLSDAVRVIREEEPPPLTTRIGRDPEALSEAAELRSTDARRLLSELKGELQWITLRALEKEPDRRYSSAAEFASDIKRMLADEPVSAGPPSTLYRLRKYARRHRARVTAAALVLATIVVGGIGAGVGFARAVRAERIARHEAESAQRVTDFLIELFATSTPDRSLGETITARTLLDIGARRIQGEEIRDPKVRARLLSAVGSAYASLGLHDEGIELLHGAADETQTSYGPQSTEYGKALSNLANQMQQVGKQDDAERMMKGSLEILSQSADRNAFAMATLRNAEWRFNQGETTEADSLLRMAITIVENEALPDTSVMITAYSMRAFSATRRTHYEEAKPDYLHALDLATALYGEKHSRVLRINRNLARTCAGLRDPDGAMRYADAGLTLARSMFPEGHPSIASAIAGRGEALMSAHRYDEAAATHEEALAMYRASYGDEHPLVADQLCFAALAYDYGRHTDLAIERMSAACALRSKLRGPENPSTASWIQTLGHFYAAAGQTDVADSLFRASIPNLETHDSAAAHAGLADISRARGRFAEADSLYLYAEALHDTTSTKQRIWYGDCLTHHAYLRALQGRHAEAESMMQTGIDIQLRADKGMEESSEMLVCYLLCSAQRVRAGNAEGAIEALKKAVVCGATERDVDLYPEIAALHSRPDYPLESSR